MASLDPSSSLPLCLVSSSYSEVGRGPTTYFSKRLQMLQKWFINVVCSCSALVRPPTAEPYLMLGTVDETNFIHSLMKYLSSTICQALDWALEI